MDSDELFSCGGKANANEWQLNRRLKNEIENVLFRPQMDRWFLVNLNLFDHVMPGATAALNLKHLTISVEKTLRFVNRSRKRKIAGAKWKSTNQRDFYLARKNICQFLIYLRSYLRGIELDPVQIGNVICLIEKDFDELLIVLENYLSELRNFDDSLLHYAGSSIPIEHLRPQFHMYHLHLEIRWLLVTLVHAKEFLGIYSAQEDFGSSKQATPLDAAVATVVDDLVYIGTKLFERISLELRDQNLKMKTPYSCTCVRELWLILQIFIDDLAEKKKSKTFWEYINQSLDARIDDKPRNASPASQLTTRNRSLECRNPEMFCIWLIYHLAILYGYNSDGIYIGSTSARIQPDYNQVERILKVYVNKGGKDGERDDIDAELQGLIILLTPLICEWWQPRVQVVSLLWDCFHRRLDQPFLLQTTGPWLLSVEKKGPVDILKQVKERLEDNPDLHKNMSSYGMFLRFLGRFLSKSQATNDTKNWNQLKVRIYSKFTNSKVDKFSETGLYNFISLFLTLALTTNASEVCNTMLDFLPSVIADGKDDKSRILVWKGNLAVFLLFAERRINFTNVSKRFIEEVDVISCRKDETSRMMLASYVDVLNEILTSSDTLELSEDSLIGGWIDRYFLECPNHKIKTLITVLVRVLEKCSFLRSSNNSAATGAEKMLEAMWKHVAGRVRMLVLEAPICGDHYHSLAELAVQFTLGAFKEPAMAQRHRHKFISLFTHFSSSLMIKDVRIVRSYLTMILQNESAVHELKNQLKKFDTLVVQAWIKCCVLEQDTGNEEIKNLTRYVVNSDEITDILQSKARIIAIEDSKVQILDFISALTERRQSLQTEQARSTLAAKCREYFNQMDKWAMMPITEKTKAASLTEWIYRCIGTLILHCAPMLYIKTQPRNALLDLINKFILPSAQTSYVVETGRKIFWMIISGIGKLDVRRDLTLQRMITELFENYLSQLITNVSNNGTCKISETLYRCFKDNNVDYHRLIFEKLSTHYIVADKGDTHKICYLVMLLLKNLLGRHSPEAHIVDIVISVCLPCVITCYMKVRDRHSHRLQTLDLISLLSANQHYKDNSKSRDNFRLTLITIVCKYLPTGPVVCFEFATAVCDIIPEMKPLFILEIEKTISELQKTKYPTNIAALRFSLNQLREAVRSTRT